MTAITLTPGIHLVASGPLGISHPLDCHAYLVETSSGPFLIDAGVDSDATGIRANIEGLGYALGELQGILMTHAHADHAGGIAALAGAADIPVIGSEAELRLLAEGSDELLGLRAAKQNGTYPTDYRYRHFDAGTALTPGWKSGDGERWLSAVSTPGHSPGSTCYLLQSPTYRALFSGDTLFLGGFISVLNVEGSEAGAYRRSLPALESLDVDGLFPGHYLFAVHGGQQHIDLTLERLQKSVIPNVVLSWLPYPQL